MDLLPSVDLLRDHLVAHDRAVREIIALDAYIEQLSENTFLSNMAYCTIPAFQKMIRIAVAEGLKRMYKEYRLMKWLKVQEMANTVRTVLDGNGTPSPAQEVQPTTGQLVQYDQGSVSENEAWQMAAPEAYQWQTAMYQFQSSPGPYIRLVSPIISPNNNSNNMVVNRQTSSPHEFSISFVENHPARRQLFHLPIQNVILDNSLHQTVNQALDCAIHNVSGLSDASDEIIDSVNIVNPHGHTPSTHELRSQPTTVPLPLTIQPSAQVPIQFQFRQPVLHPAQQEVVNQSAGYPIIPPGSYPTMPHQQMLDSEPLSDLDESMDWDEDDSSYNDSEESLAGVLFAAEHLLPEEQAVRLDVEMGDMGIGHMVFDRVSAVWYTSHNQFYRAS